jgi:hypothetical protein
MVALLRDRTRVMAGHHIPLSGVAVVGIIEDGDYPIRDWQGGTDQRATRRIAGYVRIIPQNGTYEAFGFRYAYERKPGKVKGTFWIHKQPRGVVHIGIFRKEDYLNAIESVEAWDANGQDYQHQ